MRAVTGSVASSKPTSLSKAAAILSRFAAKDNAALPEVLAYVRRASAAFDELVQFHREIRAAQKRPEVEELVDEERKKKRKRNSNDTITDQDGAATARDNGGIRVNASLADGNVNAQRGPAEVESGGDTKKKKKRKVNNYEERGELAESGDKNVVSDGNLREKARERGDEAEFGEDGKRGKKKKEETIRKAHREEEEGKMVVLEQKHKTDFDAREELEQLNDQKEHRKKKKKKQKSDRRED